MCPFQRKGEKLQRFAKSERSFEALRLCAEVSLKREVIQTGSLLVAKVAVDSLPEAAENREAFLAFLPFETRLIVHVVLRRTLFGSWLSFEIFVMVHQCLNNVKIVRHVRPGMQHSARFEDSRTQADKFVRKNTPSAMLPSPPRIWEIDVDRVDRVWLDMLFQRDSRVATDDPSVGRFPFPGTFCRSAAFLEVELQAEVIRVGVLDARVVQKEASPAADVQFDRVVVAPERRPVDPFGQIIDGDKPRSQILHAFGQRIFKFDRLFLLSHLRPRSWFCKLSFESRPASW